MVLIGIDGMLLNAPLTAIVLLLHRLACLWDLVSAALPWLAACMACVNSFTQRSRAWTRLSIHEQYHCLYISAVDAYYFALKGHVPALLTLIGLYLGLLLIKFRSAISFEAYSISASEEVQISDSTLVQTLLTENFPTGRPNHSIVYYLLLDHSCSTCRKEGNNCHINLGRVFEMVRLNWRLGCYRCLSSWQCCTAY